MSTFELFNLSFLPHSQQTEEIYRANYYEDVHPKYMLPKKCLFPSLGYTGKINEATQMETSPEVNLSFKKQIPSCISLTH